MAVLKSLPVHHFSVVIFTFSGPLGSGPLGQYDSHHFESREGLNPRLGGVRRCRTFHCLSWTGLINKKLNSVMRKPAFCICKNKDADQLCGNHAADQGLGFLYIDSAIPLLSKFELTVQPGLCQTRLETQKTGFLATRLINK